MGRNIRTPSRVVHSLGDGNGCNFNSTHEDFRGGTRSHHVAGALEHKRPFLGQVLARSIAKNRHYDCNKFLERSRVAPRVDAQASSTRTGIGGWFPHLNTNGEVDRWMSPWFSLEITREKFPCVYECGNKPALLISTLEALAVLIALKLYYGDDPGNGTTSVALVPTFTDNRGNGSALNKLMSTKFLSSALLMALSAILKKRKIKALVEWTPRESNKEADALANSVTVDLNPTLKMKVDVDKLHWCLISEALEAGRQAEDAYRKAKEQGHLPNRAKKERRKRLEDRLRMKDPW